ncbi:MAG TPA: thiamine diphosphokinase [Erysipelotrichaceae bacterium]|jgi:thiamine pyrophosphokinase|nr:thiamine diphosphokinase [Erysipelotrichaceae bacterium]
MLKKCVVLACNLTDAIPNFDCDFIGVDKGALTLANKGIMMERAIGDFDSVDEKTLKFIDKHCYKLIKLDPVKDISDSEAAVNLAKELGYEEIIILGGLGNRMDHSYVNLKLMQKEEGRVSILDKHNYIRIFKRGTYNINKLGFKYISFFPVKDCVISLENMKYPLKNKLLIENDLLGLSNEIEDNVGQLIVSQGMVMCIQSND